MTVTPAGMTVALAGMAVTLAGMAVTPAGMAVTPTGKTGAAPMDPARAEVGYPVGGRPKGPCADPVRQLDTSPSSSPRRSAVRLGARGRESGGD
jgi:hypothetical protein